MKVKLQELDDSQLLERLKKVFNDCEYIGSCSNQELLDSDYFSYLLGPAELRLLVMMRKMGVFNALRMFYWFSLVVLLVLTLLSITSLYFDDWVAELREVNIGRYYSASLLYVLSINVLNHMSRTYMWYQTYRQGGYASRLCDHLTREQLSDCELIFLSNNGIRFNEKKVLLINVDVGNQYNFFLKYI